MTLDQTAQALAELDPVCAYVNLAAYNCPGGMRAPVADRKLAIAQMLETSDGQEELLGALEDALWNEQLAYSDYETLTDAVNAAA